ncbi:MAG TPA: thioesterase domain-containing protein [Polyangiales bacterium]|nr:thioesterase domain-containing protein [Polyangiales bacterium]
MIARATPWIVRRNPRDRAALRLFLLPHAGAGTVIYRDWSADFPESIDVCAIEPPGRFPRRKERSIGDVFEFARSLQPALDPYLDLPFAIFGYSLGALMAFEVAREIRRQRKLEPVHLFAAAQKAPHMPYRSRAISREPTLSFVREIEQRYGSFDPLVKEDPETLAMVVDIMRADLGMLENYRYLEEEPFRCPILAIGGKDDVGILPKELEGWRIHTKGSFRADWCPGTHFFLRNHGQELRRLVRDAIQPSLGHGLSLT